jgi:hypothetical protein
MSIPSQAATTTPLAEILVTTTAYRAATGTGESQEEQGKIMAQAMSRHISDSSSVFVYQGHRDGWGVCQSSPDHIARFKALKFLIRVSELKGLALGQDTTPAGITAIVDLMKVNPRHFYDVCVIGGLPPISINPFTSDGGSVTMKGQYIITFGISLEERFSDIFDDNELEVIRLVSFRRQCQDDEALTFVSCRWMSRRLFRSRRHPLRRLPHL